MARQTGIIRRNGRIHIGHTEGELLPKMKYITNNASYDFEGGVWICELHREVYNRNNTRSTSHHVGALSGKDEEN